MSAAPRFSALCADLLQAGIAVRFTATGPSMAPTIRDGDTVTVVPARAGEVARGDVVLYQSTRGLTAHRIVRVIPGDPVTGFHTRGDAPASEIERVADRQVLGWVDRLKREGGSSAVPPAPSAWSSLARRVRAAWRRLEILTASRPAGGRPTGQASESQSPGPAAASGERRPVEA